MARAAAGALLSALVFERFCCQSAVADFVRVTADIVNLTYGAISPADRVALSHGFATDVAGALSLPVTDVRSLDGVSASVTLSAGVTPLPTSGPSSLLPSNNGTGHQDDRPATTTATTSLRPTTTEPASTTTAAAVMTTTTLPSTTAAAAATTLPATTTTLPGTTTTMPATTTTHPATTTTLPAATTAGADTTTAPISLTTRQPLPQNFTPADMPPLWPMRGIAYGALPCKGRSCQDRGLPSQDMLQIGYEPQWGVPGRDDLGVMKTLGGNAVRMYHSFGLNTRHSHSGFLDRAAQLGVNVMPGFHTELTWECPEFDCFHAWKEATLKGFELGYQRGNEWHPAVSMLILLNEPDFLLFSPKCQSAAQGPGSWCRVRAGLSALDGVLAAEREAGIVAAHVNLTIAWSFAQATSIDGQVTGPGYFGFQDMLAAVANPQLANYTPRSSQAELTEAYRTRWVNCLNTQAPWDYVNQIVGGNYQRFEPTPWFIGEYGANGQPRHVIEGDMRAMQEAAAEKESFMGVTFFQFQTANQKGGSEMNFGMFDLGVQQIGETGEVCDDRLTCLRWPVYCLTTDLAFLPGTLKLRAEAVASAWNGTLAHESLCGGRRLSEDFSNLGFYVQVPAGMSTAGVSAVLAAPALRQQLLRRAEFELGAGSAAVAGTLSVGGMAFNEEAASSVPSRGEANDAPQQTLAPRGLPWWGWLIVAVAAVLLAISSATLACLVARKRTKREQSMSSNV